MGDIKASLGLTRVEPRVIGFCAGWALLSLALFLLWGAPISGDRAEWFSVLASLLKIGAFLIAVLLCWRNAKEPTILSGSMVWQAITVGLGCHVLGDITVILWRSVWGIASAVSLGDIFYGASYVFLAVGLFQAVMPRQISLNWMQALGIAIAGIAGIVLAFWINFQVPQVAPPDTVAAVAVVATDEDSAGKGNKSIAAGAITKTEQKAPKIIELIDQRLSRVSDRIGLLYIAGDCVLIVLAAALLVAFWGGAYSEAWKLVALAGLCLYVADLFLVYEISQGSYVKGELWEIFWILSALFFGLGAAVEYGVSQAMQRRRPRRQRL